MAEDNDPTRAVRRPPELRPPAPRAQDPRAQDQRAPEMRSSDMRPAEARSAGQPAHRVPSGTRRDRADQAPAAYDGRNADDLANGRTEAFTRRHEVGSLEGDAKDDMINRPEDNEIRSAPTQPPGRSRVYGKPRTGDSAVRPLRVGRSASDEGPRDRRPRHIGRKILVTLAALLVVLIIASVAGYFWIGGKMNTVDALTDYDGRPAETPGQDWLLVGSDSRAGLSAAQRRKLATGKAVGKRTDTMMLLHIPDGDDKPTLISLPRDSYVPIDGHGSDKLNAAYAFGGPKLLSKTVEKATGIRIDHYMEIGFGGFVGIVDAIGGVEICVKENIKDPKAGINLKKGCQEMDGGTALGFVRTRATGAIPDFERTQRQRQFFSAVVQKAASPGTLINPFTSVPLALSAAESVAVDPDTGLFDLLSVGLAMKGGPVTSAVPIGSLPTINGQAVVKWDNEKAQRLFKALAEDKPIPKDTITK